MALLFFLRIPGIRLKYTTSEQPFDHSDSDQSEVTSQIHGVRLVFSKLSTIQETRHWRQYEIKYCQSVAEGMLA
jgi:hypothetical protein